MSLIDLHMDLASSAAPRNCPLALGSCRSGGDCCCALLPLLAYTSTSFLAADSCESRIDWNMAIRSRTLPSSSLLLPLLLPMADDGNAAAAVTLCVAQKMARRVRGQLDSSAASSSSV